MHKIAIEKLGPIENCTFSVNEFCVLTGEQASGKSTIAKAVFFFRTIKDDVLSIVIKREAALEERKTLRSMLEKQIRSKFLQIFGSSWSMDMGMKLVYFYKKNTWIRISLRESTYLGEPNYIFSEFSQDIYDCFNTLDQQVSEKGKNISQVRDMLQNLFDDDLQSIFIPAGREMITLLTNQLSYIFTIMDDSQKRSIDYCTQNYVEQILKTKPLFENGIRGMYQNKLLMSEEKVNRKLLRQMMDLIDEILKGRYLYVSGEERLMLDNHRYVKMNFASSGQQESIWILNFMFFYVLENKKTYLILEEPEAHLYPEAQKDIAELIALFLNAGNSGIVTTHSPYLLGAFNNLLYADFLGTKDAGKVTEIISADKWISKEKTSALYVKDGRISDIIDKELPVIQNETIDGISTVINMENEKLIRIHCTQGNLC